MLLFGFSLLDLLFLSPVLVLPNFWWLYQEHQLQYYSVVSKVHNSASFFFLLLIIMRCGRLTDIRWSVCILQSQKSLCVSFSRTDAGLCIYHLFVGSNLNLLLSSHYYYYYYYYYYYLLIESFSHQRQLMVIYWSLSDSESPQVSWTLLIILAVLYNVLVWMVSIPVTKPFGFVPRTPITISISITFMFHSCFYFSSEVYCIKIWLSAFNVP